MWSDGIAKKGIHQGPFRNSHRFRSQVLFARCLRWLASCSFSSFFLLSCSSSLVLHRPISRIQKGYRLGSLRSSPFLSPFFLPLTRPSPSSPLLFLPFALHLLDPPTRLDQEWVLSVSRASPFPRFLRLSTDPHPRLLAIRWINRSFRSRSRLVLLPFSLSLPFNL